MKHCSLFSLREKLDKFIASTSSDEVLHEMREVRLAMNNEMDKEETYWEQRARANWLKFGDRNSSFFHCFATQRKRLNKVSKLEDSRGRVVESDVEIAAVAKEYFEELFSTQDVSQVEGVLIGVERCISADLNLSLNRPFTQEDIYVALKSMSPLKVFGEDGLGAIFYQKFWHILGSEVALYCLGLIEGTISLFEINHTLLVLIPKVKGPRNMTQFRPISLCNVLYKIASKAIVNRFQEVLHFCVDEA